MFNWLRVDDTHARFRIFRIDFLKDNKHKVNVMTGKMTPHKRLSFLYGAQTVFFPTMSDPKLSSNWTASWQNQQNGMGAQRRLRSAWASAQSRVFAVRMKKAWVLSYPSSALRRHWSDRADAQADLSLRWAHMPFSWFCHEAAQLVLLARLQLRFFSPDLAGEGDSLVKVSRGVWVTETTVAVTNASNKTNKRWTPTVIFVDGPEPLSSRHIESKNYYIERYSRVYTYNSPVMGLVLQKLW